jgi:hypothetical protein
MKWTDWIALLGIVISLVFAHNRDPVATDVFLVLLLVIFIWLVIDWKYMSPERRTEHIRNYKARHGIPQNQRHEIDEILKR